MKPTILPNERKFYYHTNDIAIIARGFGLDEKEIEYNLSHGTWASGWVESCAKQHIYLIGGQVYNFNRIRGQKANDGILKNNGGSYLTGVRGAAFNNIKLDESGKIGSGRRGSIKDTISSLKKLDFYLVCDIRNPRIYKYVLLDCREIIILLENCVLPKSGTKTERFFGILSDHLGYSQILKVA